MKSIHIFNTEHELLEAVADYFINIGSQAIDRDNSFNVALSGGQSPQKLYQLLASDQYKNKLDWKKVNFFFGDERYVPENDPLRNSLMAQHALFDPLQISASQIFKVHTAVAPEDAAAAYFEQIKSHFKGKPIQFDLVLLGLGDNAHTASLFPFTPVLDENAVTVKSLFLKEQHMFRITMTAAMINASKQIAFLVFGNKKATAVDAILNGKIDPHKYPAQLIKPVNGALHWFLDDAAASDFTDKKNY